MINRNVNKPASISNITITGSSTNVNNIIKVVPVNEFTNNYKSEYNVLLKKSPDQQHDIMQFMDDTTSNYLFSEKQIFLQQLVNKKLKTNDEPESGVGSTFKRERKTYRVEKEEATNYKFTIDKGKAQKIFKTVPQQVNSNSRYFVFVRKDKSIFEAYPVANWYKMQPYTKMDVNTIEESEREFTKGRQAVEDQLSKMIREEKSDGYEERENRVKIGATVERGDVSEDECKEFEEVNKRKKNALFQKLRYGRKEVVDEESDKDDHEGDEVDYMSDSSCDEDKLSEEEREKIYECVNVDEEELLRGELELTDEDDEGAAGQGDKDAKREEEAGAAAGPPSSSDDDSDDSDDDDDSDDSDDNDNSGDDRPRPPKTDATTSVATGTGFKRPLTDSPLAAAAVKRPRTDDPRQREVCEEIRRHLARKPMSGKELFRMLIRKGLLVNDDQSKKRLMDAFLALSAKHDMVNGERMYRL